MLLVLLSLPPIPIHRLRDTYNEQARAIVQTPLAAVGAGASPTDARAVLDRAIKAFDKERARKHKSSSSLERRVVHLQHQHHLLQLAALDYVEAVEALYERRRLEFTVQLGGLYEAQRVLFAEVADMLANTLPDYAATIASVAQGRAAQVGCLSDGALCQLPCLVYVYACVQTCMHALSPPAC